MQYPRQLLGIVMYWSIFLIISCTLGSYARTPRQSGRQRGRVGARSIDLLDSTHVTKVCARKQARFDWSFNLSLSGSTSRAQVTYAGREIVPVSELALFSFLSIGRFFGTIWAPATKSYQKIVPPQNSFIYGKTLPIPPLLAFWFPRVLTTLTTFPVPLRILFILSTYPHV